MLEHRMDAAEVGPRLPLADDADELVDRGRTGGNQRQQGLRHGDTLLLDRRHGCRRQPRPAAITLTRRTRQHAAAAAAPARLKVPSYLPPRHGHAAAPGPPQTDPAQPDQPRPTTSLNSPRSGGLGLPLRRALLRPVCSRTSAPCQALGRKDRSTEATGAAVVRGENRPAGEMPAVRWLRVSLKCVMNNRPPQL